MKTILKVSIAILILGCCILSYSIGQKVLKNMYNVIQRELNKEAE